MSVANTYDDVPYTTKPRRVTHPDTFATASVLAGLTPTPVTACRVLELGCGTGGNLLPMAATLPGSTFVGIDLSTVQIDMANRAVRQIGLTNIDFRAASILEIDASWGRFDYIICHGVYSWVPPDVQEKILAICGELLTAQGIAFVSYNTLPGWHFRRPIREMMEFHVRRLTDPADRVAAARGFLTFLTRAVPDQDGSYAKVLHEEAELLAQAPDHYLFHEHLEANNLPIYFSEFMTRASAHGLQFVAESGHVQRTAELPADVVAAIQQVSPDLVHVEQYLDFLYNRPFRRTLLCPAAVSLSRKPTPAILDTLLVEAGAKPESEPVDLSATTEVTFRSQEGTELTTNSPVAKAMLTILWETWPRAMAVPELARRVAERIPEAWTADPTRGLRSIYQMLLQGYTTGTLVLHTHDIGYPITPSEKPIAFPVARVQAVDTDRVATQTHQEVLVDASDRAVLQLLDGTRDVSAVAAALQGELGLNEAIVAKTVARFARFGLLVG